MPKLETLRRQLDGSAARQQQQFDQNISNLVKGNTDALEAKLAEGLAAVLSETSGQSDTIRKDLAGIPQPILKMIAESHRSLSERIDAIENRVTQGVTKSSENVIQALSGAIESLERLEGREFPETDLSGVSADVKVASMGLKAGIDELGKLVTANSKAIRELQKPRKFEFDFIRDKRWGQLEKVTGREVK